MKQYRQIVLTAATATAVALLCSAGCSTVSPYDYADNWLIRENDIPQFHATYDLFYLGEAPTGYGNTRRDCFNWAKTHTSDTFGNRVRVFAPRISNPDVKKTVAALQYYLDHFHQKNHPFILLAEGKFADLIYQAMRKVSGLSVENGFVAAYLPDMTPRSTNEIADDFYWDNLRPAAGADDYGVIVSWRSCINGEEPSAANAPSGVYNINPLNWHTDATPGTAAENITAIFYMPETKNRFSRKQEIPNFCGAVIDPAQGVLKIQCPSKPLYSVNGKFPDNSISIFAGNLAANAALRTRTLIADRQWSKMK